MSIEAMKLALEALEWDDCYDTSVILQKAAIELLRKAIAEAEKQKPLTNALTDREKSIIRFSVYRFSWAAHARLNEAAQDKNNFHYDIGAVEAFAKDCKDADALLVKLNFVLGIKENT